MQAKCTYIHYEDDMASKLIRCSGINSENAVNFGFPYSGSQRAELELRIHVALGKDVMGGEEHLKG